MENLAKQEHPEEFLKNARRFYHRMTKVASDLSVFCKVRMDSPWFRRLCKMRFAKKIASRVKHDFDLKTVTKELERTRGAAFDAPLGDLGDALALWDNGPRCVGLQVLRTSASEIEPWQIIVLGIDTSDNTYTPDQLYNAVEYQTGTLPHGVNAVLPDEQDQGMLCKLLYGYVFTQTPHLYMGSQRRALLVTMWVFSLECVFRECNSVGVIKGKKRPDVDYVERHMNICYRLGERIAKGGGSILPLGETRQRLEDSLDRGGPLTHLVSEAHGVLSMCMFLVALCDPSMKTVVNHPKFSRLMFVMMSETIRRACRAHLRATKTEASQLIRQIVQVGETSHRSHVFDLGRATLVTGRFYNKRYTNCTPFALVACLGFIEHHQRGATSQDIAACFTGRKIAMRGFLEKLFSGRETTGTLGRETQVALFLEGCRHIKASQTPPDDLEKMCTTEPKCIIDEHISDAKKWFQTKEKLSKRLEGKRQIRRQRLIEAAIPWRDYHSGQPVLFSYKETDRLNQARPPNDQLEVRPHSHLLLRHCCFPNCPMFLKNLGKEKKQVWSHFDHDQNPLDNYIPAFHKVCIPLARRCTSRNDFLEKARSVLESDPKLSVWTRKADKMSPVRADLESMWDQYHEKIAN
jgi:hypothetical protein